MRRYPFAPLEAAARCATDGQLAERLGVPKRQLYRWQRYGVTEDQADVLAVRVGFHPWSLWPEMIDGDDGRSDRRARWARQRYKTNPAFRASKIDSARRYYEENGDYVRSRVSRYERTHREQINARRRLRYQERKEARDAVV